MWCKIKGMNIESKEQSVQPRVMREGIKGEVKTFHSGLELDRSSWGKKHLGRSSFCTYYTATLFTQIEGWLSHGILLTLHIST